MKKEGRATMKRAGIMMGQDGFMYLGSYTLIAVCGRFCDWKRVEMGPDAESQSSRLKVRCTLMRKLVGFADHDQQTSKEAH